MTQTVALIFVFVGLAVALYTYLGYPALLWLLGRVRGLPGGGVGSGPNALPTVSIVVPAYNEEDQMEALIRSLLALDYPKDRVQILIVSDASTDRTDEIVAQWRGSGIEFLRMPERGGKTKLENAAAGHLRGDIVLNTDASTRISAGALMHLVSAFEDPTVGLASGRDISVSADSAQGNIGESGYVGYEMMVRDLETGASGIVGASGCLYAVRPEIHRVRLPDTLSRDFAAALLTKEAGYRAVSVPDATCLVPRTASLRKEYARKVRTIVRGMDTLAYKRNLLNPFHYPLFAWKLASHKICRWLLPWFAAATFLALGVLSGESAWAFGLFSLGSAGLILGMVGFALSDRARLPRVFSMPAFLLMGNVAAMAALIRFVLGDREAIWEPTRRKVIHGEPVPPTRERE